MLNKLVVSAMCVMLAFGSAITVKAQNEIIRLDTKNLSLGKLINSIESQTNRRTAFSLQNLDTTATIHFPESRITLEQALHKMTSENNLKYILDGQYIALVPLDFNTRSQVYSQRTNDIFERPGEQGSSPLQRPESQDGQIMVLYDTIPAPKVSYPGPYNNYYNLDGMRRLQGSLPRFALKSNILYGSIAFAPNIAFEFPVSLKGTVEISGSYNGWKRDGKDLNDRKQNVHSIFRVEYRQWLCERYSGSFYGGHVFYAPFHVNATKVPLLFHKDRRYKGNGYGIGALYGYNLVLNRRWNAEFAVGLGAAYLKYDQYSCDVCDRSPVKNEKWYFGPTRAAVTLTFLLR